MQKIIRTSTIPESLNILLKGQLKFLNSYYNVIAVSGKNNFLTELGSREGVKVYGIDIEREISIFKDIKSLVKLYFYFRKEKPTIVHSITPKAGLLSMIAAKFAGVPIRMHTFTGLIFPTRTGLMQKLLITMDKLLCWAATNIYPEGEGVKQDLLNYKITKKPLKIIANGNVNGIDLKYFSVSQVTAEAKINLKKSLNITNKDFVFIFVGRLVGDKGINELIKAFGKLKKPSIKLLLVGPFEFKLDPLNAKTLEDIKTNANIISVGFQSDVRPYFAISNALVFPSYREGFPNVVMQSGAMGLPSIVSNINGCNEIILDGENGIIVPAKDSEKLKKAMENMLLDKIYYSKLQANARLFIESRYEQSFVWEALLKEYKTLLKQKDRDL